MTGTNREKIDGMIVDVRERAKPFDKLLEELEEQLRTISPDHPGCPIGVDRPIDVGGGPLFVDPCRQVPKIYSGNCFATAPVKVTAADFADALRRMRGKLKGAEEQDAFLRMLRQALVHLRDAEGGGPA